MLASTLAELQSDLRPFNARLVAVSKTYSAERILEAYDLGQRDFGENRVQELVDKAQSLPSDIRWHFIGHLQSNKAKNIIPFVHLIHAVDSLKLLQEIDKRARANNRIINVLLQFKIAEEDTKYGYKAEDIFKMLDGGEWNALSNLHIVGVMGMATYTDDLAQVKREFAQLKAYFDRLKSQYFAKDAVFKEISMGMSGDYQLALEQGSTMVRIGSKFFGSRA